MQFRPLTIPDAYVVEEERKGDDRGFFARAYCREEFAAHGLHPQFVQANNSLSAIKGTLRGLHYQLGKHAEDKLLRCINGAFCVMVVDVRPESPTFLKYATAEITAEARNAIYVPRGCANGIITLEPDTELFYLVSNFYAPEAERGLRWNDPKLGIIWPAEPVLISPKDAAHPDFNPEYHLNPEYGSFA